MPGSKFVLDVNTVIIAIGTSPNPLIKSTTKGLEVNKKGGIVVEEGTGLNAKFRVRHIPTLLLINKGEILDTLVEPKKVEAFDEFVQKALKEI